MRQLLPLLTLLPLLACDPEPGDSTPDTSDSAPDAWGLGDLGGSCGYEDHVGRFELAHWDGADEHFATATGEVLDGVIPVTVLYEAASEGGCTLWQKINPFCEQPCEPDEACDHQGECVPYPVPQDVGAVEISGLTEPLVLTADAYGNYWDTTVGYPLFDPGAAITASADELFDLRGLGVESIEVPDPNWLLVQGEDMPVSWTAGSSDALVEITFNIDQHGSSPLTMICELPDTGSASIPADLLEQIVANGVSGYPSSWIRRHTADSVPIPGGCADLLVYSHLAVDMQVEGHTPCSGDWDCPEGQRCDLERQTCVDD